MVALLEKSELNSGIRNRKQRNAQNEATRCRQATSGGRLTALSAVRIRYLSLGARGLCTPFHLQPFFVEPARQRHHSLHPNRMEIF